MDVDRGARESRTGTCNEPERPPAGVTGVQATVISHFYRGEVQRANTWRMRLDHTTNWAVITTGGLISFAFGAPLRGQVVLLLNSVLVLFFLLIEARRYRYYDVWRTRIRSLEVNWIVPFLDPSSGDPEAPTSPSPVVRRHEQLWRRALVKDLQKPRFKITLAEAFGRRLRRNYIYLYLLIAFAWLVDAGIVLEQGYTVGFFIDQAGLGILPGWSVVAFQFALVAAIGVTAVVTARVRRASGKVQRGVEPELERVVDDDTMF